MLKTCVICGAEYKPNSHTQKICLSKECKSKAQAIRRKRFSDKNKVVVTGSKVCVRCGKEYTGKSYKYCSDKCKAEAKTETARENARKQYAKKVKTKIYNQFIDTMITECIQDQFGTRKEKLYNYFRIKDYDDNTFVSQKVNVNRVVIGSVERGSCDLRSYQKVINKLDQIISLF